MSSLNPWAQGKERKGDVSHDLAANVWRVQSPVSFDWPAVDGARLRALFLAAANMGKTVTIGPAVGGRGVIIGYYLPKPPHPKKFALSPGELHDLIDQLLEAWSPSEDLVALCRVHHAPGDVDLVAD